MGWLERRIKELAEQAAENTLAGTKDQFDAAVSRYRAYKELLADIEQHHKDHPEGDVDDND